MVKHIVASIKGAVNRFPWEDDEQVAVALLLALPFIVVVLAFKIQ